MTAPITLYFGLTFALSATIVLFAVSLRRLAQVSPFPRSALVPVVTPILTWRAGARALSIGLAVSMTLYGLLWISAALGRLT